MQQDELTDLIDKTATLMTQYERHGQQIDGRLQNLAEVLQRLTQQLPAEVRASSSDLLRTVPGEMLNRMRESLDRSMDDHRQSLRVAGSEAESASLKLAAQIDQLQRLHRHLVWKTTGAVVLTLLLLLAGGAWLSMHFAQIIRDNQLTADQMKAYNGADMVLCGEHALCANVDIKGLRYGEHRQYLPVRTR